MTLVSAAGSVSAPGTEFDSSAKYRPVFECTCTSKHPSQLNNPTQSNLIVLPQSFVGSSRCKFDKQGWRRRHVDVLSAFGRFDGSFTSALMILRERRTLCLVWSRLFESETKRMAAMATTRVIGCIPADRHDCQSKLESPAISPSDNQKKQKDKGLSHHSGFCSRFSRSFRKVISSPTLWAYPVPLLRSRPDTTNLVHWH